MGEATEGRRFRAGRRFHVGLSRALQLSASSSFEQRWGAPFSPEPSDIGLESSRSIRQ